MRSRSRWADMRLRFGFMRCIIGYMEPLSPHFVPPRILHRRTAVRWAVAALTAAILVGAYFVAAQFRSWWPYATLAPAEQSGVQYRNEQYGLLVSLPESWRGYSVPSEQGETAAWHATEVSTGNEVASGPMVVLRNPQWTDATHYEDLPIMVFTPGEWAHVRGPSDVEWSVSAAPIPPSVLASNSAFVFALPARYNYDFAQDWEVVQQLVDSHAVQAFEP